MRRRQCRAPAAACTRLPATPRTHRHRPIRPTAPAAQAAAARPCSQSLAPLFGPQRGRRHHPGRSGEQIGGMWGLSSLAACFGPRKRRGEAPGEQQGEPLQNGRRRGRRRRPRGLGESPRAAPAAGRRRRQCLLPPGTRCSARHPVSLLLPAAPLRVPPPDAATADNNGISPLSGRLSIAFSELLLSGFRRCFRPCADAQLAQCCCIGILVAAPAVA